jgi:hypothetical protein
MSDTLTNALSQAGRSSSVLQGIQNPAVLNPLAGMGSAISAVQGMQGLAAKQGEQLVGQALQQATDPDTGVLDTQKAQRIAAGMGPSAAYAMQDFLKTGSQLRGEQITQGQSINTNITRAGVSLMRDSSDANVDATFDNLIATNPGQRQLYEAERQRVKAMPQPQRADYAYQHVIGQLSAADQYISQLGQTSLQDFGGVKQPYTLTQPRPGAPGGGYAGPGATTVGPPPGSTTTSTEPFDEQGLIPRDANGVPQRTPKYWAPTTKPVTAVPGIPPGGQPVAPPPGSPPSGTIPPNPNVPPGTPPGRIMPPNPALANPNKPPVPAATPPAASPQPPANIPPASTPQPPIVTAPPQGQPEKLKADVEAYTQDQAAYPNVQTRAQNMAHAYDALQQLKSATGKGAQGINDLRSYAQTLGILPPGAVNEQKLVEIITKYTERAMIEAAGGSSTDMGRRMAEQSNAGTLLSTPANLEILRNDMGKTLQTMAAYKDHKDTTGNGYLENRAKLADTTDPRGFVWNLYSQDEQKKINAEVDKDPDAAAKLHKAIGMANRLKLQIPGLTTAPTPQKQSFLAPPTPAPNPLMMAG